MGILGFCIVGRGSLNKKYVSSKRLSDKQAVIRLSKDAIKRESNLGCFY